MPRRKRQLCRRLPLGLAGFAQAPAGFEKQTNQFISALAHPCVHMVALFGLRLVREAGKIPFAYQRHLIARTLA
jgi:hypothetical protein